MNIKPGKYIRFALLMLFGLLSSALVAASNAATDINIIDPYVRAVPPGQPNSAAFMQLHNHGPKRHAIVKAESPASKVVELHTHIMEGGVMKMRQVKKIDVPAKHKTILKPGGLHIMFLGLKSELNPGQIVPVTLFFEDGSKTTVRAPVRKMQLHMPHK